MGKIEAKIVLTGGPGAGKTTALARIEEDLQEKGYHVLVVSESATELIKGGIRPFGYPAIDMIKFQSLIVPYQLNKEKTYDAACELLPDDCKCVIIYDRGVMDNAAYVEEQQFDKILQTLSLNRLELLDRYNMVLHLVTAADGKEKYYTLENNEARTETIEEAKRLDQKAMQAWSGHNRLTIIDNTTDFDEKMQRVLDSIHRLLGCPISLKQQKVYTVDLEKSNLDTHLYHKIEIEQYYLKHTGDNYERRIRVRTQDVKATYYYTVQKKESHGLSKIVTDKKITEKEFMRMMNTYEIDSSLKKTRYCFIRNKQYFKLDVLENGLALLQLDTTEDNPNITFPKELYVLEDVTDDPNYQSAQLARKTISNDKKKQQIFL